MKLKAGFIWSGCFFLFCISLFSCIERRYYYLNPLHTNTAIYKPLPAQTDSQKTATYASASLMVGSANDRGADGVTGLYINLHQARTAGPVQFFYGISASAGTYHVKQPDGYWFGNNPLDTIFIGANAGTKFTGSYGVFGGVFYVPLVVSRFEWRVVGIEASHYGEYGQYLRFRQKLSDSTANGYMSKASFTSFGLATEFLFKTRRQTKIGFRLSYGYTPAKILNGYYNLGDRRPQYLSWAGQITKKRTTGFIQFSAGDYAFNFKLGCAYRL